jgi:hypothetical protein
MATEGLPDAAPVLTFDEVRTRRTVGAGHTLARVSAANLVALARPARRFVTQQTGVYNFRVSYQRSHSAIKHLYLAAFTRAHPLTFPLPTNTLTLDLTIKDAAGVTVSSSASTIPSGFRSGTSRTPTTASSPLARFLMIADGFLDLDALAATLTTPPWSFEFAATRTGTTLVIDRVEGFEVPRTLVDSDDDFGVLTGPFNPGNAVVAGSVSTVGYERLSKTIEGAILCGRDYVNVAWPADTAYGLSPRTSSASYVALTNLTDGSDPLPFYCYPRVVYHPSSATGERARFRVLYYVSGGGTAAVQLATGASSSPYQITGLTGASWQWSAWADCDLPTDGTDRVAELLFKGKTNAGTLYLAGIHVQENAG